MSNNQKRTPRIPPKDINTHTNDKKTKETPASKKRNRHQNSPSPEAKPPSKIPTITMPQTDNAVTIDVIRSLLADQTKSLETSIRNEMKTLSDEIKSEFQAKITELNDKIDANQQNVQQQINDLKSNVANCTEQSTCYDDDMQRMLKLCELKISGIAYKSDENLNVTFNEISKLVQFDLTTGINMPTLTRIYKYNHASKTSTPTPIIIVKFVANHIRDDFYRLYLNKIAAKQPITTDNIGLPNSTRIIIGENLTTKNHEIFVEAGKHKKQGNLCQVFTQNGLIQVKAVKTTKATCIRSLRELELFVLANPPTSTANQMETESIPGTSNVNNNGSITTNNDNNNALNQATEAHKQTQTQQQQAK